MNNTLNKLIERAKKVQSPVLGHYTELEVTHGNGTYLYDINEKAYLDFTCGIAVTNIGHCHPKVIEAAKKQVESLIHNCAGVTYNEANIAFMEKLVSVAPQELEHVFLCQSGSEAIEGCIKLAKYVTKKPGIIAFKGGFHGRTLGATSITSSKEKYYEPYQPLLPEMHIVERSIAAVEQIDLSRIAGIVTELVVGEGGYFVQDKNFIQELRNVCDKKGILLIFDEVQTGFGRTGKMFASEHFNVVPDAMALAKGIASGFPLGAVVMKKRFSEQWATSAHGGTYTGNLIACAAGTATIEVLKNELPELPAKAEKLSNVLLSIQKAYPDMVKEVRGLGMMQALDIGNSALVKKIRFAALEKGLLIISCGPNDDILRIIPPLTVSVKELEQFSTILHEVFSEL